MIRAKRPSRGGDGLFTLRIGGHATGTAPSPRKTFEKPTFTWPIRKDFRPSHSFTLSGRFCGFRLDGRRSFPYPKMHQNWVIDGWPVLQQLAEDTDQSNRHRVGSG